MPHTLLSKNQSLTVSTLHRHNAQTIFFHHNTAIAYWQLLLPHKQGIEINRSVLSPKEGIGVELKNDEAQGSSRISAALIFAMMFSPLRIPFENI
jgi:hypothetical protein